MGSILVVDDHEWMEYLIVGLRAHNVGSTCIHASDRVRLFRLTHEPGLVAGAVVDWYIMEQGILSRLVTALQDAGVPVLFYSNVVPWGDWLKIPFVRKTDVTENLGHILAILQAGRPA